MYRFRENGPHCHTIFGLYFFLAVIKKYETYPPTCVAVAAATLILNSIKHYRIIEIESQKGMTKLRLAEVRTLSVFRMLRIRDNQLHHSADRGTFHPNNNIHYSYSARLSNSPQSLKHFK